MKQGWEIKRLDDIIESNVIGLTKNSSEQDIHHKFKYVKMNNITRDNRFDLSKYTCVDATKLEAEKYSLSDGDFLFNTRNSYELVGKTCLFEGFNNEVILYNNNIMRIRFIKKINPFFINYAFSTEDLIKKIDRLKSGTTNVSAIYYKDLKNLELSVPPLPEQQRIVAILDEAFAAIAKAKTNAEQNLKNAKELFERYLQGVFENKGDGWEEKTLIEITSKIGSGATPRGGNESYKTEGISLVRSMNVHDFEFRERNLALIDEQQAKELNNVTLQENDVLLNITGASVARCCVIPKEYLPARVNQHVSIIRAKKEIIDPIFLNLLLTSKFYKDQLLFTGEQGATRQAITKAQLEVFKIAFPKSIKEQKSLMSKLDALSTETKKLEAIYQQKINDLEELKKSVLQKAFRGELKTAKALVL